MIYLDNAATTRVDDEVVKIVNKYMNELYGNPSSLHHFGLTAENAVDKSAKIIAKAINCSPKEILFTSGGTESNNIALLGYYLHHPTKIKHYITTLVEHHAVLSPLSHLEKMGNKVTYLPVNSEGLIDEGELVTALTDDTYLISLIYINNETGAINNIPRAVQALKDAGYTGYIHTDATQALGKIDIDVKALGVDFLSASGHKFNAPKGVGLLYISERVKFKSLILGGGQQSGRRSGTLNVPSVAGMAVALSQKTKQMTERYTKAKALEEHLISGVMSSGYRAKILAVRNKSPYITSIAFKNIKSEVLLHSLEGEAIYVSSQSACASHRKGTLSHVIKAMSVPNNYADGVIRISFDDQTMASDIDALLAALNKIVPKLINIIGD